MNKYFLLIILILMNCVLFSQQPTADELLAYVDNNEIFETIQYEGEMVIYHQNRRIVKTMNAWGRGNSDSFIEFTNPEDRGTRYLKRGGRLMVYSPDVEGVMLISGHLLRESMMGSDLSYEDTIDNDKLSARYTPSIIGTEEIDDRLAWILELNAISRTESYPKRQLWIDVENFDLLKQELFALSGAKLKEYKLIRVETLAGRRFPVETEFKDLLRRGSRTVVIMKNVILDQPISDSVFTERNLRR